MTNIVAFNTRTGRDAAAPGTPTIEPNSSPLMFTAYERPLWYEGKTGTRFGSTGHKALIKMQDDTPACLNVVKDTYKLIQNAELFRAVEDGMFHALGHEWRNCQIVDKIAHMGRLCYRQYIFTDKVVESPERDRIVFRVIVQNGFGGSAIKLHAGAIDMFCTNGMILGDFTSEYAKHTSGVQISRFKEVVQGAVDIFWKNKGTWKMLRDTVLKDDEAVLKWLREQFSELLGSKLFRQYMVEKNVRGGGNMWALYSAMTYYASHADGEFGLRQTKNDHAAATMLAREQAVHSVLRSDAWAELRKAA